MSEIISPSRERKLLRTPSRQVAALRDYTTLTRPLIVALALTTAGGGYALNAQPVRLVPLLLLLAGTGLVIGAANTANQALEKDVDAMMRRTRHRPLADERVNVTSALRFMGLQVLAGTALLLFINVTTALLALAAFALYVFVYTPLKRKLPMSVYVGAIPGAMPPLLGQVAATGHITPHGVAFFAFMYMWQLPHFLAIGWIHRDDYQTAGLRVFAVDDNTGLGSGETAVLFTTLLMGLCTSAYTPFNTLNKLETQILWFGAAILLLLSVQFFFSRTERTARHLFTGTVLFLLLAMGNVAVSRF